MLVLLCIAARLLQLILLGIDCILFYQTCLSKGGGYHCPPCHIVSVGGLQFLLDCPLDLSALTIFSPIPTGSNAVLDEDSDCSPRTSLDSKNGRKRQKMDKTLNADDLIRSEPCYKTVTNLHLWDLSFIDVVLISTPMGMLGLPFLTRTKGFSAKVMAYTICSLHFAICYMWSQCKQPILEIILFDCFG